MWHRVFLNLFREKRAFARFAIMSVPVAGIGVAVVSCSHWAGAAAAEGLRSVNLPKDPFESGTIFRDCPTCPQMVVIPAGSFLMGSPESDQDARDDERPQHRVTIAKPFAVSKVEVTFDEWNICVAAGGCDYSPSDEGWGKGLRPIIHVSWDDITKQYLPWLNKVTGQSYRLPTEAEFEYATRAGTTTRYWWGDELGENNANCFGCKSQWDNLQTAPVGSFKPNGFGLYDMHGNVWEWVQDCYSDKAYLTAPTDGSAAPEFPNCDRVLRGGSWMGNPRSLRAAFRNSFFPSYRLEGYSFRVARALRTTE
jgi:formylglycine-generating enzyme required for sulfatase activity